MADKKEQKIKVLVIAPSMRLVGGQSIQAARLIDAFADNEKIEMRFLPNNPESSFQNVKILRTLAASLKFWRLLFKHIPQTDIVHIFSSGTTSYLISTLPPLFVAKLFGKKTILNYHTGEAEEHLKNWKLTARPTMKRFDKIVVPSPFLVHIFDKFGLRAASIFNFVDTGKYVFRARDPLKPVFLSNRNFEKHYRVADVLRAFRLIEQNFPAAKLTVAGSGSEAQSLKKLAEELDLKNIEFIGRIEPSEMPKIYDSADIYLNSSIVDNMPLSIIEAFACGLPVVSTNAGGIPFIVTHEKTGLLVETNDYEGLAREAIRLLKDHDLARNLILEARAACTKYSWENVKNDWIELYGKLNN